jgi:hypothetical protein
MAYWVIDQFYKPFVDTANYYGKTNRNLVVSGGMPTKAIDTYREGVNLRTVQDIYNSNQLKLIVQDGTQDKLSKPNGEMIHESPFITYGQAGDFTQYTANTSFNDSHVGVEGTMLVGNGIRVSKTTNYLIESGLIVEGYVNADDVYPIYMNGGPQFYEESIIEPFPMPYRLATNESPQEQIRGVYAFLEAGNEGDERRFGTDVVEQMVYREQPTVFRAFLEYGANYLIVTNSSGVVVGVVDIKPNAVMDQTVQPKFKPWVDEANGQYFPQLTNTINLLGITVTSSVVTLNGDIVGTKTQPFFSENYEISDSYLQTRDQKSATAGFTYGNVALYGTDSVAFGGMFRGA